MGRIKIGDRVQIKSSCVVPPEDMAEFELCHFGTVVDIKKRSILVMLDEGSVELFPAFRLDVCPAE